MALPITIPNTFANATTSIPLSQLDNNFSTVVVAINGIGNGAEALANVNITGGNVNITTLTATTGNITTVNATTVDATNIEVTNIKAKDGTAAVTIANTTGILSLSNVLVTVAGSNTAPAITTTGDTNTGIFFPAADTIAFAEGGVEAMRINSNGQVGIGLTTPSVPLEIQSDGAALGVVLRGRSADNISVLRFVSFDTSTNYGQLDVRPSAFFINAVANVPMIFNTNNTERMRLMSTGRLGINTTAPSTQFQVNSTTEWGVNLRAASDTDTFRCMYLTQRAKGTLASPTVPISGTIIGGLEAGAYNGTDYTFGFNGGAAIQIQAEGTWTSTSTPSNITFWTNPSGGAGYIQRMIIQADGSIAFKAGSSLTSHFFTYNENGAEINLCDETGTIGTLLDQSNNSTRLLELINGSNMFIGTGASNTTGVVQFATQNTERMRIIAAGDVGIGTSSPGKRLEVYQDNSSTTTTTGILVTNVNTTSNTRAGIVFRNFDNFGSAIWSPRTGSTAGELVFGTKLDTGNIGETDITERMRITRAGNLLIGDNTLTGVRLGSQALASNHAGLFNSQSAGWASLVVVNSGTPTVDFIAFRATNGGSNVGSITYNGSATAYNTSSDYRLKENIAPLTGALEKVAQLKPCTYTWKTNGSAGQGFIAHELQTVVPDAVTGEKDAVDEEGKPKYQGVDTSFLVATLTAAIQELKAELDATKAEVALLKSK